MEVLYLRLAHTSEVPLDPSRTLPSELPLFQMSVDAGWPFLWVLAFCAGYWRAEQQKKTQKSSLIGVLENKFFFSRTVLENKAYQ